MDSSVLSHVSPELMAILAWMAKDLILSSRTQTQKNTEDLGAMKVQLARLEKDLNAAHSNIRELKERGKSP